jgi:hypothetical protein
MRCKEMNTKNSDAKAGNFFAPLCNIVCDAAEWVPVAGPGLRITWPAPRLRHRLQQAVRAAPLKPAEAA